MIEYRAYRGFLVGPVNMGITMRQWSADVITPNNEWLIGLGYPLSRNDIRINMVIVHCGSRRRAEKKIIRKIDKIIRKHR
jgi:hypothetical protein